MKAKALDRLNTNRRAFIGGSDARIIMGDDEDAGVRTADEAAAVGLFPSFRRSF